MIIEKTNEQTSQEVLYDMQKIIALNNPDEDLKRDMESTCKAMGLTVSAAYTLFAKKVTQEKRIPFEIVADPFYSSENMERLRRIADDVNVLRRRRVTAFFMSAFRVQFDHYKNAPQKRKQTPQRASSLYRGASRDARTRNIL